MPPEQRKQPHAVANIETPTPPLGLQHRPGIVPGTVDVTGTVPEGVHVDPDLTEGHPGYEESGDSGILSTERLSEEQH